MSGRCLLMIGKWTTAHKVSIDEPKQESLTQAGISRYGEPQNIADLMTFPVSLAAHRMTSTQIPVEEGELKSI
jgi:3-oxoacyl-[acyl-carrier protein] reductase